MERFFVRVDGKDHALSTVTAGRFVLLLAIEISWQVAVDHSVEWLELRNVCPINILEIRANFGTGQFRASVSERGFSECVIGGSEIEVKFLANGELR